MPSSLAAVPVWSLLALTLVACGSDPDPVDPPDDTDTDTGVDTGAPTTDTEPMPWVVSGQQGTMFAVQRVENGQIRGSYSVNAIFGDSLQGLATASWCQAGGLCLPELPAAGSSVDSREVGLDPAASLWAWNGHQLTVGTVAMNFQYDDATGLGWYESRLPEMPDTSPIPFEIDRGEWGSYAGEIVIPEPLELTSPGFDIAVPLTDVLELRWTPTGEDDVYLRVTADGFERVWHLEDDGEFDLDLDSLALEGAVDITVARWNVQEIDVNGNALTVVGVWEQPLATLACEAADYPNVNLSVGAYNPPQPIIEPDSFSVSFQLVVDDERIRDFWFDVYDDGKMDPLTSAIIFEFYDAAGVALCSITYDASDATFVGQPAVSGSGTIFEAWELDIEKGYSDCQALDSAVWGTKDLRDVVEQLDWGVGIGTISDLTDELSAFYGATWGGTEPYRNGAYVKYAGSWVEVSDVQGTGMQMCGVADTDLNAALPKLTGAPLPIRLYLSQPLVTFDL